METKETVNSDYKESQDQKLVGETTAKVSDKMPPKTANKKASYGGFSFIAFICFFVAIFFACKAYDVKNVYSSENKYVGGDAFNFIINASYFTGYLISSVIAALGGIVSRVAVGIIKAINKSTN